MLTLILAEAALETVPEELWSHPAVEKHALRRGKKPGQLLLDRSLHHTAMKSLRYASKRGRPDITHFFLLEALSSPLNKDGLLRLYIHTINDFVISVNPVARLPRNYDRFVGLLEQLFEAGRVPPTGEALLSLERRSLEELLSDLKPTRVVLFTHRGKPDLLSNVASRLASEDRPLAIIGGFPRGHLGEEVRGLADEQVCIDPEALEAWTVASKLIHEYERAIGLPERRLKRIKSNLNAGCGI